jgi:hypothetical protein
MSSAARLFSEADALFGPPTEATTGVETKQTTTRPRVVATPPLVSPPPLTRGCVQMASQWKHARFCLSLETPWSRVLPKTLRRKGSGYATECAKGHCRRTATVQTSRHWLCMPCTHIDVMATIVKYRRPFVDISTGPPYLSYSDSDLRLTATIRDKWQAFARPGMVPRWCDWMRQKYTRLNESDRIRLSVLADENMRCVCISAGGAYDSLFLQKVPFAALLGSIVGFLSPVDGVRAILTCKMLRVGALQPHGLCVSGIKLYDRSILGDQLPTTLLSRAPSSLTLSVRDYKLAQLALDVMTMPLWRTHLRSFTLHDSAFGRMQNLYPERTIMQHAPHLVYYQGTTPQGTHAHIEEMDLSASLSIHETTPSFALHNAHFPSLRRMGLSGTVDLDFISDLPLIELTLRCTLLDWSAPGLSQTALTLRKLVLSGDLPGNQYPNVPLADFMMDGLRILTELTDLSLIGVAPSWIRAGHKWTEREIFSATPMHALIPVSVQTLVIVDHDSHIASAAAVDRLLRGSKLPSLTSLACSHISLDPHELKTLFPGLKTCATLPAMKAEDGSFVCTELARPFLSS